MPLMPGAEPYRHEGGPVGVLLCHGFTGTPQSLRPWAEYLAGAGLTVSLPRLPGHGTTWRDMADTSWPDWYAELERELAALGDACDRVFVMGLSLGGCLALRLAERHGSRITGLVLVNPSLAMDDKLLLLAPVLRFVVPSVRGLTGDIHKKDAHEVGYDRVPLKAAASLPALWSRTRAELPAVTHPILVFRSPRDHVVSGASLETLRREAHAATLTVRSCEDSYHVATLDHDAPGIFAGSLDFVREHVLSLPEPE